VIRILTGLGACALICSAQVLAISPDDELARQVALQWLQVVDSGSYKDAALMMSEQVRGSQDWSNYFAIHRAPLGRVNKRQIVELKHASTVPGDPELRQHGIIRFKTSFERKAIVVEELIVTKMGC
jgi:hypothetical protein